MKRIGIFSQLNRRFDFDVDLGDCCPSSNVFDDRVDLVSLSCLHWMIVMIVVI